MARARARSLPLVTAGALLLASVSGSAIAAADDPEAAVLALFEAVAARELEELDGLVCSEEQAVVRGTFGDGALGIDIMAQSLGSMGVSLSTPQVEILDSDATAARAAVRGTLSLEADDGRVREFVREIIEESAGPDDPPVSDEDIEAALPLVADALAFDQPIDTVVSLVREDDGWVVCSGFGVEGDDPDDAEPIVSTDGLCELATPAELSELSSLAYDSSTGVDQFCTFSQSDWDEYHAATVSVIFDTTLEVWSEVFPPDGELEVAGAAAFSSGADVFSQAGEDVLQVSVSMPDALPEDVDAVTQASRISELFLPRLDELVIVGDVTEATAGPSLCDGLSLQDLNLTSGRVFDGAAGDRDYCTWSATDSADTVVATVTGLSLDEFREILGDTTEGQIDGLATLSTPTQAVIELADGRSLDVSVSYDQSADPDLPAYLLALTLAEWLAPEVPALRGMAEAIEGGLLAGRDYVDDLCAALSADELTDISGVPFEDPGRGTDFCEYFGGDEASGRHYVATSLEHRPISSWLEDYPEGESVTIAGRPAVLASGVTPERGDSATVVVEVPGYEDLTFAAFIGIDTSTGTQVDTVAVAQTIVELGLMRLIDSDD